MERDVAELRCLLSEATAAIAREYFLLPVADARGGRPLVEYRERVYAYELYHQLRKRWPQWRYSLGGEVDKNRHPIVRGGDLDRAKPDLLVHVPGVMDHNLAVIEVKPLRSVANAKMAQAIERDLRKLIAFRSGSIGYAAAFLIVFGEPIEGVLIQARRSRKRGLDIELVEIYHHANPGEPACVVGW